MLLLIGAETNFDRHWLMRFIFPRRANEITAFPAGAGFSVAWKNKLLELWNVFMLPHFLNRECVGVLFTFWKSLFENEISRDYLKGIVSFPYADIFH